MPRLRLGHFYVGYRKVLDQKFGLSLVVTRPEQSAIPSVLCAYSESYTGHFSAISIKRRLPTTGDANY